MKLMQKKEVMWKEVKYLSKSLENTKVKISLRTRVKKSSYFDIYTQISPLYIQNSELVI